MLLALTNDTTLVALITAATTVIVAVIARGQNQTARRIGDPNGHGSISQAMDTVIARIDAQDVASARERTEHNEGKDRQLHILDSIRKLEDAHANFLTRGEADELKVALDRLTALIGEPQDGWDETPLLPYVHQWRHDMARDLTKRDLATQALVQKALDALASATSKETT